MHHDLTSSRVTIVIANDYIKLKIEWKIISTEVGNVSAAVRTQFNHKAQ